MSQSADPETRYSAEVLVAPTWEPGRFKFIVTTNGTVRSDAVIDLLNAGKFMIILSIDGPGETHDECRKKKSGAVSHKDVMGFLEAVRSRTSCHIEGAAVIRSGSRLLRASQYLRTLPIHSVKAQLVRLRAGAPYALSKEERELYKQDLEAIGQTVIEELEAGKIPMDHRFDNRVLQLLIKDNKVRFCEAGLTCFGITPSGSILSCLLVSESDAVLGHVNDDPKTWREAGRKWSAKPHRQKCLSCSDFQLCAGGCPAIVPICGDEECDIIAKNCEVARHIYEHFQDNREALLALAGIT